ncbi:putative TIR domain, P-loop containing nucleoside triphosphate hydrolase [Medicago truncatula]|uniref:Putative TIR domain, P-loop containing nucleoside triphosphate hydrolase n=1 Tax=Medicago truncatula TaxID=3880 RepID=A0A396HNB8_MEDTR|nr:disease resistance protein RPV1 [Medicago truncatula]XP_024641820.1 disease resistance protein RPV1 [Medicago truncatula]RHN52357.1 putative TIR domain, P-loop containing nucleoside triphosphate hydrolase [Medicago truncatula]
MAMQSPSYSSSSLISYGFTYQVFLNFRGSDTRDGFTGHLYKALTDKGIHTFIDDCDLKRGDEITPSLIKAIEESRIFIPVFSINYASSKFCLDELVHIIHCYKTKGRLVLPVFYGVDPTQIRHQSGSYGEHLTKHEESFQNNKKNKERLHQWKLALTQAANLSGYHYSPGYEYKFIGKIVEDISNKINRVILHVAKYPVGLESRLEQVKLLLDKESDEGVHMVGLYGTGGLGKSTLAKAIYNFVADQFEGVCFLHNVRENSAHNNLKHLQKELLSKTVKVNIKFGHICEGIPIIKERLCRKKILLILDDVNQLDQLEALAGGLDWFGPGSRVIITTRDKHLLTCHGIERTYAVRGLYGTEALELLRWMAFKNNKVPPSYEDVLNRAVSYASGLPLVLEIVGSNLYGKSIEEWKGTLDGYEKIPNKKIHEILKVSYDALEEEQQSVFLDIACCFKGCRWEEFEDILRYHYGHCITHHLGVLAEKSLIYQNHGYLRLHDLIKDMGKEVVRQESRKEPGEQSRLWCQDEIVHVLKENTGTSKIEMIYMNFHSMESVIDQKGKAFKKMTKLKTLIIENGHFSKGLKYLPSSLRVLKWKGCLSESLSSSILSKKFQNMKVLTLNCCEYLTHIPDVSDLQNLEKFSFMFCKNLITIDDSIGHLNKLESLDAGCCSKLKRFPPLGLTSLKQLELSGCESLKNFPELLCKMRNIKHIFLSRTSIGELPSSFHNLSELRSLHIFGMFRFPKPNDKIYSVVFSNVDHLVLENCNLFDESLLIILKWCVNLKNLVLAKNNFKILPEFLSECHHLVEIIVDGCTSLEEIRGIPPNLKWLSALRCESLSSSSRRMLLSQKLHKAGCIEEILMPNGIEGIPDWFEHQIVRGDTISFWFRKNIPSITCIIVIPESVEIEKFNVFLNDKEITTMECLLYPKDISPGHSILFDMKLDENIYESFANKSELYGAFKNNEWNHVELIWKLYYWSDMEEDDWSDTEEGEKEMIILSSGVQMGIHVSWNGYDWSDTEVEKSNKEGEVRFTNPYSRKRKLDEYLFIYSNTLLSQFVPPLKKQRLVEVGVSKTEILQQHNLVALVSDMRDLVLTETKQKEHHG